MEMEKKKEAVKEENAACRGPRKRCHLPDCSSARRLLVNCARSEVGKWRSPVLE
jgi:hypothetical protein